jgi:ubiquinone/menaquinone biosynthesis C-methylase UbiE
MSRSYVPALRFRWLTRWFDRVAEAALRERQLKALLIEKVGLEPRHRVLDVGAGTGTLALMIEQAQPHARVVGIDGDPEILELARQKVTAADGRVELREAMAYELPFDDASFDRAVSSLVFHHLSREDKRRTLAEVRRVLATGGSLHILDWGRAQNWVMRLAFLGVQLLDGFATTRDNVRGDLVPLMVEAGFVDVQETHSIPTLFGTISPYRASRGSDERSA